jgi:uncharacterized protein with HEPN domain
VPSKDPIRRFEDILESIARIERFTSGMDFAAFSANEQVVYAVNHALLILSEASAKLGEQAEQLCPGIAWADIRGLGNRLRHDYDNINLIRIWLVVERELASLKSGVSDALQKLHEPPR